MAVGEETNVADAMKSVGHGMLQEAADKLVGGEGHHLGFAVLPIVLPGEAHLAVVEPDQAAVGDGNAVGVAAEIAKHLLGSGEWRFGVDDPVGLGQRVEPGSEAGGDGQRSERTGEAELTRGECRVQLLEEPIAEAAGEHADGQKEAGWAGDPVCLVGRDAAARDDAM